MGKVCGVSVTYVADVDKEQGHVTLVWSLCVFLSIAKISLVLAVLETSLIRSSSQAFVQIWLINKIQLFSIFVCKLLVHVTSL